MLAENKLIGFYKKYVEITVFNGNKFLGVMYKKDNDYIELKNLFGLHTIHVCNIKDIKIAKGA